MQLEKSHSEMHNLLFFTRDAYTQRRHSAVYAIPGVCHSVCLSVIRHLGNDTRYDCSWYGTLIGSHTWCSLRYCFQLPSETTNHPFCKFAPLYYLLNC